ncbi:class I SAM-dependent methyltransferase [Plesiomonas shigelloides subsp. oncorhynchi]|nr:class I SAM-dependent methyltransferase [Plesiomonas shigelloides]
MRRSGKRFCPVTLPRSQHSSPPRAFSDQGITIRDQRYQVYRSQTDFIRRYIFPGGFLPSLTVILDTLTRHTDLNVVQVHDFGHHYAKTLHIWRDAFNAKAAAIQQLGASDEFMRLWDFTLLTARLDF